MQSSLAMLDYSGLEAVLENLKYSTKSQPFNDSMVLKKLEKGVIFSSLEDYKTILQRASAMFEGKDSALGYLPLVMYGALINMRSKKETRFFEWMNDAEGEPVKVPAEATKVLNEPFAVSNGHSHCNAADNIARPPTQRTVNAFFEWLNALIIKDQEAYSGLFNGTCLEVAGIVLGYMCLYMLRAVLMDPNSVMASIRRNFRNSLEQIFGIKMPIAAVHPHQAIFSMLKDISFESGVAIPRLFRACIATMIAVESAEYVADKKLMIGALNSGWMFHCKFYGMPVVKHLTQLNEMLGTKGIRHLIEYMAIDFVKVEREAVNIALEKSSESFTIKDGVYSSGNQTIKLPAYIKYEVNAPSSLIWSWARIISTAYLANLSAKRTRDLLSMCAHGIKILDPTSNVLALHALKEVSPRFSLFYKKYMQTLVSTLKSKSDTAASSTEKQD